MVRMKVTHPGRTLRACGNSVSDGSHAADPCQGECRGSFACRANSLRGHTEQFCLYGVKGSQKSSTRARQPEDLRPCVGRLRLIWNAQGVYNAAVVGLYAGHRVFLSNGDRWKAWLTSRS